MESSFELASLHMRGLVSMIQLRGGLENFNHLQTLQRVITWADFCFSSTWSLPPWFPLLDSLSQPLVPFDRQHRVRHVQPVMGKRFLNICEPPESLLTLLDMLRSISQSISLFPTIGSDRVAISNSIYVVEYKLLSIQHLHLGRQHAKNQIDISECVSLAALLYLHLAVRELPLKAHRHKQLKERLFHSLPHDQNLSSAVGSETDLTLLLWAFFIGMDTTTRQEPQESLIKRMSELSTVLCLEKYEDFISALKTVLWMDQFCEPRAIHLWDEITLRTRETMQLFHLNVVY
ncbi:hypothetical protein BGW36DRAFT_387928 [Talaromyces proteolyticus]|uniref:Uncharacterized protein n=1 Tax=Talaromyces proteolyticus TaxID=1131652 RepID=A0AAD4KGJ6_9EURO|nr:uncharacterized protein BGW36DRAFT_387928 [Talaromyces proteolyticus]KAH8691240.1 hypothetical protein BGW36DRAFT_387928 [Talaromyces proteolyticus]